MTSKLPDCVLTRRSTTAEGPVWDEALACFIWLDIPQRVVNSYSPSNGTNKTWSVLEEVGAVALTRQKGIYLLAGSTSLWMFDLKNESLSPVAPVNLGEQELRLNDGRVDRRGRWLVGSLVARENDKPLAGLYCFDQRFQQTRKVGGVLVSNGLAFSPDDRILYHADSRRRVIWRYRYDPDDGTISDRTVFYEFASDDGVPDGAAVDVEGGYWCALHGGWRVCRIVEGRIDAEIRLPVAKPTMCAFGGERRRDLLITTGSRYFNAKDWQEQPLAGSLFMIDVGIAGIPDHVAGLSPVQTESP